ncbi:MAG TPA: class I SAM-dependent methyltransferase [Bryobacteraceae bacterium]|nr:class I SAM-dependent methyltransferase [Bryobacteraceae bacterium]
MELEEEKLIDEILWRNSTRNYFTSGPWEPEIAPLKSLLKRIWNSGDYDRLSRYMEMEAEAFYRRLAVPPGSRLLDVACGSGQLALIAARRGADATGIDIAENMIERAQERARVEGLKTRFYEADAEDLPFANAAFNVVASLAGVIFSPRPERAARELLRVCRRGGIIAMANWTPEGFIGQLFQMVSRFVAPSGMPDPLLWGNEATVRERLHTGVSGMELTRRKIALNFPFPPGEVVRFFRACYGPVNRAFASLNREGRMRLQTDMEELWETHNLAKGGFTRVDAEWLEVVAKRA